MNRIEVSLIVEKDNVPAFKKALETIIQEQVLVGVPATKADRKEGPISNAALAYIHNTGSPAQNIPARPFMEPGIKDAQDTIVKLMKQVAQAALHGNRDAVLRGLNAVGLKVASAIKSRIQSNTPPPLSPGTIAARKRRGITRENTLIDKGELRNSISYVLQSIKKRLM